MVQRRIYTDTKVDEVRNNLVKLGFTFESDNYGGFEGKLGHVEAAVRPADERLDQFHLDKTGVLPTSAIHFGDIHRIDGCETREFCPKGRELFLQVLKNLENRTISDVLGNVIPVIHTVTFNPAIDIRNGNKYAGGKGINVSRALHNLGITEVLTYTFAGGARGEELLYLMEEAGLDYVVQETEEETRKTDIVQGWPEVKESSESPLVHGSETAQLVGKLEKNVSSGDYVVLAGSLSKGINPRIYGYLISTLQAKGAKVILDSSQTEPLQYGMWQKPFAMKPNEKEWEAVTGVSGAIDTVLEAMSKAHSLEYAIAMQGPKGLTLVNSCGAIRAIPPEIFVGSTVGSGDAVTAGFIYGKLHNFVDESLARFAVACGTASAEKEGTELCTLDDAMKMAKDVKIE